MQFKGELDPSGLLSSSDIDKIRWDLEELNIHIRFDVWWNGDLETNIQYDAEVQSYGIAKENSLAVQSFLSYVGDMAKAYVVKNRKLLVDQLTIRSLEFFCQAPMKWGLVVHFLFKEIAPKPKEQRKCPV